MKNKSKISLGLITRYHEVRQDNINADNRTIDLSFSSEDEYERHFGIEILSHKEAHVDMGFISSGNAPLLAGHNHNDQIGVVEKAWLQDGVGNARVRFGRSDRANEFFQDVQDGIRKNVSVGYYIKEMELQEENTKGADKYLVTRWKPVEASIVAVPADETVGIRSADDEIETIIINDNITKEAETMPEIKEEKKEEIKVDMNEIREIERKRQADILAIGRMSEMDDEAMVAVRNGESVADFRAKAFDNVIDKQAQPAVDMDSFSEKDKKDMRDYSFVKAIREAGDNKLSGIESEMHQEGIKQLKSAGVTAQGTLSIPYQILAQQRDLTVGTDDQGGYTVATNLQTGSFIELLQNRMKVRDMGATILDNLVGDIAIPSQATGASAAWEGENDAGSEQSLTFGQLALSPNRVGCYSEVSKKLLVQSSMAVDNMVKNDLATAIALAIDLAALHGTGANDQPTGIAATSGIGSVAGGTNGLIPTQGNIVELETDVAVANADVGKMGYLTNAKVRGILKQVFTNATYGEIPLWKSGQLNGYRAEVSNQVSAGLTKGSASGTCSAIFFGNWADLVVGLWGGLDIVVDPYSLATTNLTRITLNTYADVGVRHAASFSAMLDALVA